MVNRWDFHIKEFYYRTVGLSHEYRGPIHHRGRKPAMGGTQSHTEPGTEDELLPPQPSGQANMWNNAVSCVSCGGCGGPASSASHATRMIRGAPSIRPVPSETPWSRQILAREREAPWSRKSHFSLTLCMVCGDSAVDQASGVIGVYWYLFSNLISPCMFVCSGISGILSVHTSVTAWPWRRPKSARLTVSMMC